MADVLKRGSELRAAGRPLARLKGLPWVQVVLLLIIWVGLPLIPEGSGIKFGLGYQALFTSMLLLGTLVFWLLGRQKLASPRSTGRVVASLGGVFLVTIALLVVAGVVYPQFDLPLPPGAAAEEAAERGEDLFRSSNVGCLTCHTVSGEGGIRGPDLTHVASRAGERVPGLAAEQYLLEKVGAGASYQYNVPEFVPMMPGFAKRLTEEQLQDVVAFLLSLE